MVKPMIVVQCGEMMTQGTLKKKQIVLRELDGYYKDGRHYGAIVADMLGNLAECNFYPNDMVMVAIHFNAHEYEGNVYADIVVRDIHKMN